jgi:hypothetical protein
VLDDSCHQTVGFAIEDEDNVIVLFVVEEGFDKGVVKGGGHGSDIWR